MKFTYEISADQQNVSIIAPDGSKMILKNDDRAFTVFDDFSDEVCDYLNTLTWDEVIAIRNGN